VIGHVTDTRKVAYLPNHHQCRLVQIFIDLTQLFEGETVRPLDGAHADVDEANLAEFYFQLLRRMEMRTGKAPSACPRSRAPTTRPSQPGTGGGSLRLA